MSEKKNKKKKIETEDYSQQKAWLFLIAYFIFFTAVIISIRSNNSNNSTKEKEKEFVFNFERIEKGNYTFQYQLLMDNNQVIYEGKRNKEKSLFTKNSNGIIENYFESSDLYVKQVNNLWIKEVNPYPIPKLIDMDYLKGILQKATYDSKTNYSNKSQMYTYQISTTTLMESYENKQIDIADQVNKISISFDSNKDVEKIEYDFTPYAQYNKIATTTYRFTMTFDNFSDVEELNI